MEDAEELAEETFEHYQDAFSMHVDMSDSDTEKASEKASQYPRPQKKSGSTCFPSQTERSDSWRGLLLRASDHHATI